jgi:cation diffusion facilitator family transporter
MSETDTSIKIYEQPIFINFILTLFGIALFIIKLIFSVVTNSLALQADAFDNMTDIVMYLTAFIGITFAKKKPNERFPYGYYKMENIVSLIISLFIFYTAYNIILSSITSIIAGFSGTPNIIHFSSLVAIFLIISLFASIGITIYLKLLNKKIKSPIIESESNEKLFDILISSSVLVGYIGASINIYILDSIISLLIAIFIIKGGYNTFLESTKVLLDAVINFEKRSELYNLIKKTPNIKKIENMEIRSYGRYIFLEVEIHLSKNIPLDQISAFKKKVETIIMEHFPLIFKVIIIIQGSEKTISINAVPLETNQGSDSTISDHFGESPFFGFLEFQEGKLIKYEIKPNNFIKEKKRKGILVSDWLISEKIDKIYLKNPLKKGPSLIFNNNFVQIELIDVTFLKEILL